LYGRRQFIRTQRVTNRKEGLSPGAARRRDAQKWFQVTRWIARSPTGMHGQSLASATALREPFIPRRRYYPASDQNSGARPLSVPVEACVSIRPFTLRQRSLALRRVPVAGSMLLACIFDAIPESRLARSASCSRPRPLFISGGARSLQVARYQFSIPEPSVCLRTATPLQDLSILRDLSALSECTRKNLPLRVARSAFAPRRVAIMNYCAATDRRSGSATSRLAHYPSNLLEPAS